MGILISGYYGRGDMEPSKLVFKVSVATTSAQDYERCISAIRMFPDGIKVKLVSGLYYKVPITLATYCILQKIKREMPEVKILIDNNYIPYFKKYQTDFDAEVKKYSGELATIRLLWEYKKTRKSIDLQNYSFPKFKLYHHQLLLFAMGALVRRCAIYAGTGTGKTACALHAFRYKYLKNQVKKCLVIVPNSLKYKWAVGRGNEIDKHTDLNGMVLDGAKQERDNTIGLFTKNKDMQFLITSYNFWSGTKEGTLNDDGTCKISNRNDAQFEAILNSGIDMVICDESHRLKNPEANVTKNIKKWLKDIPNNLLITGTPLPNQLVDIYTQYFIMDSSVYGESYHGFFNRYFLPEAKYPTFKNQLVEKDFDNKMKSKALVFKTEDCIDLPKTVENTLYVDISDEYKRILSDIHPEDISKMTGGVKDSDNIMKLLTACSGFTYNEEGEGVRFKHNPKAEILTDLLDDILSSDGNKAIIWYNFRFDVILIKEILQKLGHKFMCITTEDKVADRMRIIQEFEAQTECKILLTSPHLTAEGFDIITANHAIYYDLNFRFDLIKQTEARNRRMGSAELHSHIFYHRIIMRDTVEELVLAALTRKLSYQEMVFGIQDYIKKHKVINLGGAKQCVI